MIKKSICWNCGTPIKIRPIKKKPKVYLCHNCKKLLDKKRYLDKKE